MNTWILIEILTPLFQFSIALISNTHDTRLGFINHLSWPEIKLRSVLCLLSSQDITDS